MDHALTRRIAARFAALPPSDRKVFAQKMREQGIAFSQLPVPQADRSSPLRPSPAQQRLWFLWKLDPASSAYHLKSALRLTGTLDIDALHASFDTLMARQEALRTTFVEDADGDVRQEIDQRTRFDRRSIDVSGDVSPEHAATAWASSVAAEPFDLSRGPLLRVGVATLGERAHLLVVSMHHIISDGVSIGVLLREFVAGYRSRVGADAETLPELLIQAADHAHWQRLWLEAGEEERQLGYWRERLDGEQPSLALATDHPRTASASYSAASERVVIPRDVAARLTRVARDHGATTYMLLLAAFQALLHRYTGQRDIRVGVPIANRQGIETQGLIGFLVNTQVMRAELPEGLTLAGLLEQVRSRTLEAQSHPDLPFDVLVEALRPERSAGRTPLFQAMFNHQRQDWRAVDQLPGLTATLVELGGAAAQFELTLETTEAPDGTLDAVLRFARELFEPSTMQGMGRHYLRMLEACCGDLHSRIDALDMVGEDERRELKALGCDDTAYRGQPCVQALFQAQARWTPDSVAVACGDVTLTYRELEARANRLAHRLGALGVGLETRVGIAIDRSVEMVVALLAVLKAGAAYVPLDPVYPLDRLAAMIDDSGLALLLTQERVRNRLPETSSAITLDVDTVELSSEPESAPLVDVRGEHLAYVIYTSGSTGRPKGVMVRHAGLTNLLLSTRGRPGLTSQDRLVAVTSLSFDIAALELFLPLVSGARIVVAESGIARDGRELAHLLRRSAATVMQATPSTWRQLLDAGWRGALKGLCGGEALPPDLAESLREAGIALWNMYGPTETTIWSSAQFVDDVPSLGLPLAATQLHVLDASMNPVPKGAAGELYIGGDGAARGYWRRAALTAERFVPDPFSSAGQRLYRTGDLARWTAVGTLAYLGRIDHQVKVRGFRIELGEIESRLLECADVQEAVATAAQGRLIGYVTARAGAGASLDPLALRHALASTLPDYMVPTAIVVIERFPLTPNGKIDRRALPQPEVASAEQDLPLGPVETALAAIWCEVLPIDVVHRGDDFFSLGGHSLLLMQVAMRIERRLDVRLPLRDVFDHPRLDDLARVVEARSTTAPDPAMPLAWPQIRRVGLGDTFPLSPSQVRLWTADRLAERGSAAYNMSAAVRLTGDLDGDRVARTITALVRRHDVLRTVFPMVDGEPAAFVRDDIEVQVARIDAAGAAAAAPWNAVERLIRDRSHAAIDVAVGPIFDAALIRVGDRDHVLVFTVHHLVSDAWSMSVLTRDFAAFYRADAPGASTGLAALPIRYVDYAAWQRDLLAGPARAALTSSWRDALAGAPTEPAFAGDLPRAASPSHEGAAVRFVLDASLRTRVEGLAARLKVTPFVLLLASFQLFVHRRAGVEDLVVGTDVAGRPLPDLEDLVGFFVNVLPLRSWLDADALSATFVDRVAATRNAALEAFERDALPFDQIVEAAQVPRDRRWHPLVQMLFVLQTAPAPDLDLPGLRVTPLALPSAHSKFDMALFLTPGEDTWQVDWVYATRLFRPSTIESFAHAWRNLLEEVVNHPEAPLSAALVAAEAKSPAPSVGAATDRHEAKAAKLKGLVARKRPAAGESPAPARERTLIRTSFLEGRTTMPIIVEPNVSDLDAAAWASAHRGFIDELLQRHATILFRNFELPTAQSFEAFAEAISPGLYGSYGDLPKKEGGNRTYRSTPYPEKEMILFHNESSHQDRWPRKQWFYCELPSRVGGATPVVDCRRMLRELPGELVAKFERLGLVYVRTFTDGLDVPWQDFFMTDSRAEVESRCRGSGVHCEWLSNGELQTRTSAPAVIVHPQTGERCFFNQVQLHHPHFLKPEVRADLLRMVGADRLPRSVRYGDGSEIDVSVLEEISRAYEACAIRFDWQAGDVAMLDNMLAAHARDPYEEPRRIVVAMGEMIGSREVRWRGGVADASPVPVADDLAAEVDAQ